MCFKDILSYVDFDAREGRSGLGHEERFPPLWLNVRCVIRQGTFAGTNGNARDAP
jgi:hypothetical protein